MSLAAATRPVLSFYSLWEEFMKELRVMSFSHVRMAPIKNQKKVACQREIKVSAIQRGLAHLTRPINDTCPESSRPYSV